MTVSSENKQLKNELKTCFFTRTVHMHFQNAEQYFRNVKENNITCLIFIEFPQLMIEISV